MFYVSYIIERLNSHVRRCQNPARGQKVAKRHPEGKTYKLFFYKYYCLCCRPIYSGRQACGRTSRGRTGFLHLPSAVLALIFPARRIQPSISLVDLEVEFYVLTN